MYNSFILNKDMKIEWDPKNLRTFLVNDKKFVIVPFPVIFDLTSLIKSYEIFLWQLNDGWIIK